jgi:hypothetical protein
VLAVGDEEFQRRCIAKFHEFQDDGRTIVVVSHAMGTMRSLCDQVAWLDHGRLQGVGAPQEIVDEYVDDAQTSAKAQDAEKAYSREVSIERMEVLGPDDGAAPVASGHPATFRLHYTAQARVEDPIFKIGIHSVGGTYVTGPSSRDAGLTVPTVASAGHVDIHVPSLDLVPGSYVLSSTVYDSNRDRAYHRPLPLRFDVERGTSREKFGVLSLNADWRDVPTAAVPQGE